MIPLYRGGRQAEALAAYQAARQRLVEELGLEPGPALQRLECAILKQDASLEPPGQAAAGPPDPAERTAQPWLIGPEWGKGRSQQDDLALPAPRLSGHTGRPRTHRMRLTAVAVAVAGVVAAGLFLGASSTHGRRPALAGANGLVAVSTARMGPATAAGRS
jgi:hypothetical protein